MNGMTTMASSVWKCWFSTTMMASQRQLTTILVMVVGPTSVSNSVWPQCPYGEARGGMVALAFWQKVMVVVVSASGERCCRFLVGHLRRADDYWID
jgi:hypothetical protein